MNRKYLKNFSFVIYIFIITLILLELVLFLTGRYLLWSRRREFENKNKVFQVVCVGDSHTFGVGTAKQYSYPAQLEELLNHNNDFPKFSIINLGIPGASTKRQIKELESFFKNNTAEIVILLTGRNNSLPVKEWRVTSLAEKLTYQISGLRTVRFLRRVIKNTFEKKELFTANIKMKGRIDYDDYLTFYLTRAMKSSSDNGARLILLSYYNSSDKVVKDFARRLKVPYLDFTEDFKQLFELREREQYLSPDMSHMNYRGYRFFAERLYRYLFLDRTHLGFTINPLLKKMHDRNFYVNKEIIGQIVKEQLIRIEQKKNTPDYPFELIHLGHIYTEIGNQKKAKKFYTMGLRSSGYIDNNTIVSPIINWYLKNGQKEDALKICQEILQHNPENTLAQYYLNRLGSKAEIAGKDIIY